MPPEPPVGYDRGPYYSPQQVADQLGVTIDTVRRVYMTPNGDLPCYRFGGTRTTIRIAKTDLDAWIERHRDDGANAPTPPPERRRRRRTP